MLFNECNGKPKPEFVEKVCPECGDIIEMMTTDPVGVCDTCGHVVYNDALSCALWCDKAKECIGEEAYERMMKYADRIEIDPRVKNRFF